MNSMEYIDDYFKGGFLPEQKKQFERRILEDPVFAEEVAFYLSSLHVAKAQVAEEKKKRFREIYHEGGTNGYVRPASPLWGRPAAAIIAMKQSPIFRTWPYVAAAAMIAAIVFGLYFFNLPTSPKQLADQYIEKNLALLGISMGNSNDAMETGKRLYNDGKLTEALIQFENAARENPSNSDAKEFAGIVSLRLNNYEKALEYFRLLETHRNLYSNPAIFYQALTLMKRNRPGDKERVKPLLQQVVEKNLEGKAAAQQWLDKL